ncbi:hypothetical protein FZI91_00640 [Mycobacterium sp. CBMA271]|uniref:hypothetical protein n=1 Tax=unclassified Mycobacteroides TaxID=2618759 RepID=UPI0012DC637C|nr:MULTISPECIES: hypothetical protein [unclassified Mycobacteroides]MUM16742.1 hypothetical protein [Mycobacteroides sp. CBMA 326]MUM20216.1 hypothetical protein [Mycobacteroides sp. CBMA 271]
MRFAVALMAGLGLVIWMPAVPAHADALCSEYMAMDDGAKMDVIHDVAAMGSPVAAISPKDARDLATAICRMHGSANVSDVMLHPANYSS